MMSSKQLNERDKDSLSDKSDGSVVENGIK